MALGLLDTILWSSSRRFRSAKVASLCHNAPARLLEASVRNFVIHLLLYDAYSLFRRLVDRGCKLVGHGLNKDFRIIDIVVPANQVIDTVELYSLEVRNPYMLLPFHNFHVLGGSAEDFAQVFGRFTARHGHPAEHARQHRRRSHGTLIIIFH